MYVKKLEDAGMTRQQAETQVEIMTDMIQGDLATKNDLEKEVMRLDTRLNQESTRLENKLVQEVSRLEHRMTEMEFRLTTRLGSIMVIGVGVIASLIKFL